jgi:hypothetical protein
MAYARRGTYTLDMEDIGFAVLIIVGILCVPARRDDTLKTRLAALKRSIGA